ncbi:MAG: AAA family ATPase [Pseudomonadota bacterium]
MPDKHELGLLLKSSVPLVCIETRDEPTVLRLLTDIAIGASANQHRPLFRWSVTDGLQRIDIELAPQPLNSEPTDVLGHIRAITTPGIYCLLDFHPYLNDPLHVRKIKDICIAFAKNGSKLVLISASISLPDDLQHFSASYQMSFPNEQRRKQIVQDIAREWRDQNGGQSVRSDRRALDMLVRNLAGLSTGDVKRLARNAIADDGVIDDSDIEQVMQAKYKLLNNDGVLSYEYDTAKFAELAGMRRLKDWIRKRRRVFVGESDNAALDPPKGVLLIGVQGCGKSLAAKATAGALGTPLLRLEFGSLFNKYHGETERNLREALQMAGTMAPCVLWIDELEKGLAGRDDSSGTAQRVLGTFLTWMAERQPGVFIVATANEIERLPPELVRKGRFDEIFFVDLPASDIREEILSIHLRRRGFPCDTIALPEVAAATDRFSGAELEQLVVSAFYAADAEQQTLSTAHLIEEASKTRPLAVVMREGIDRLRAWASARTVPAD